VKTEADTLSVFTHYPRPHHLSGVRGGPWLGLFASHPLLGGRAGHAPVESGDPGGWEWGGRVYSLSRSGLLGHAGGEGAAGRLLPRGVIVGGPAVRCGRPGDLTRPHNYTCYKKKLPKHPKYPTKKPTADHIQNHNHPQQPISPSQTNKSLPSNRANSSHLKTPPPPLPISPPQNNKIKPTKITPPKKPNHQKKTKTPTYGLC